MTFIWLVGTSDVESNVVRYVCTTKEKALQRWEELRQELIQLELELIERSKENGESDSYNAISYRILENLRKYTTPEEMDNYPQEQPYVHQMELDE